MKRWLVWLTVCCALGFFGTYAWTHRRTPVIYVPATPVAEQEQQPGPETSYAEAREAQQMVTITGPLADYVLHRNTDTVETVQPVSRKATTDHLAGGPSPVGTSTPILCKTFAVAAEANLPFEIPAHASSPQLRGTYRSFIGQSGLGHNGIRQGGVQSSDEDADVELSLFNERQYADFLNGRPAEALFSAEAAHDQEVNFTMPPTFGQPAKYYLVFNNGSHGAGKKFVQADFRVDF